jgi:hypothetical protein
MKLLIAGVSGLLFLDGLLGTELPRDCMLDLDQIIKASNLADLEAPFDIDEIWQAVKRLPAR